MVPGDLVASNDGFCERSERLSKGGCEIIPIMSKLDLCQIDDFKTAMAIPSAWLTSHASQT